MNSKATSNVERVCSTETLERGMVLLKISEHSKFRYRIYGITANLVKELNVATDLKDWLWGKRQNNESIKIKPEGAISPIFKENLFLISDHFEEILARALLISYSVKNRTVKNVVNTLKQANPLHYPLDRLDIYAYRFKHFLSALALGMSPDFRWSGYDKEGCKYLINTQKGEIFSFDVLKRRQFEEKLFNLAYFDNADMFHKEDLPICNDKSGYYLDLYLKIRI